MVIFDPNGSHDAMTVEKLADLALISDCMPLVWPKARILFQRLGRGMVCFIPDEKLGFDIGYKTRAQVVELESDFALELVDTYEPLNCAVIAVVSFDGDFGVYLMEFVPEADPQPPIAQTPLCA